MNRRNDNLAEQRSGGAADRDQSSASSNSDDIHRTSKPEGVAAEDSAAQQNDHIAPVNADDEMNVRAINQALGARPECGAGRAPQVFTITNSGESHETATLMDSPHQPSRPQLRLATTETLGERIVRLARVATAMHMGAVNAAQCDATETRGATL